MIVTRSPCSLLKHKLQRQPGKTGYMFVAAVGILTFTISSLGGGSSTKLLAPGEYKTPLLATEPAHCQARDSSDWSAWDGDFAQTLGADGYDSQWLKAVMLPDFNLTRSVVSPMPDVPAKLSFLFGKWGIPRKKCSDEFGAGMTQQELMYKCKDQRKNTALGRWGWALYWSATLAEDFFHTHSEVRIARFAVDQSVYFFCLAGHNDPHCATRLSLFCLVITSGEPVVRNAHTACR